MRRLWAGCIFIAIGAAFIGCIALTGKLTIPARAVELAARGVLEPSHHTLIVGDSVAVLSAGPMLCGDRSFNAAIGGSGVRAWSWIEPLVAGTVHPDVEVVALGVNDAIVEHLRPERDWAADYDKLVRHLRAPTKILVSTLPVQPFAKGKLFSPERIAFQDRHIRRIAIEIGAAVIPAVSTRGLVTSDGVHPNAAGQRAWRARLRAGACGVMPSVG